MININIISFFLAQNLHQNDQTPSPHRYMDKPLQTSLPDLGLFIESDKQLCNLCIQNLPIEWDSQQLFDYFKIFGQITSCRKVTNRNLGFVAFADETETARAALYTNKREITKGNFLNVKYKKPRDKDKAGPDHAILGSSHSVMESLWRKKVDEFQHGGDQKASLLAPPMNVNPYFVGQPQSLGAGIPRGPNTLYTYTGIGAPPPQNHASSLPMTLPSGSDLPHTEILRSVIPDYPHYKQFKKAIREGEEPFKKNYFIQDWPKLCIVGVLNLAKNETANSLKDLFNRRDILSVQLCQEYNPYNLSSAPNKTNCAMVICKDQYVARMLVENYHLTYNEERTEKYMLYQFSDSDFKELLVPDGPNLTQTIRFYDAMRSILGRAFGQRTAFRLSKILKFYISNRILHRRLKEAYEACFEDLTIVKKTQWFLLPQENNFKLMEPAIEEKINELKNDESNSISFKEIAQKDGTAFVLAGEITDVDAATEFLMEIFTVQTDSDDIENRRILQLQNATEEKIHQKGEIVNPKDEERAENYLDRLTTLYQKFIKPGTINIEDAMQVNSIEDDLIYCLETDAQISENMPYYRRSDNNIENDGTDNVETFFVNTMKHDRRAKELQDDREKRRKEVDDVIEIIDHDDGKEKEKEKVGGNQLAQAQEILKSLAAAQAFSQAASHTFNVNILNHNVKVDNHPGSSTTKTQTSAVRELPEPRKALPNPVDLVPPKIVNPMLQHTSKSVGLLGAAPGVQITHGQLPQDLPQISPPTVSPGLLGLNPFKELPSIPGPSKPAVSGVGQIPLLKNAPIAALMPGQVSGVPISDNKNVFRPNGSEVVATNEELPDQMYVFRDAYLRQEPSSLMKMYLYHRGQGKNNTLAVTFCSPVLLHLHCKHFKTIKTNSVALPATLCPDAIQICLNYIHGVNITQMLGGKKLGKVTTNQMLKIIKAAAYFGINDIVQRITPIVTGCKIPKGRVQPEIKKSVEGKEAMIKYRTTGPFFTIKQDELDWIISKVHNNWSVPYFVPPGQKLENVFQLPMANSLIQKQNTRSSEVINLDDIEDEDKAIDLTAQKSSSEDEDCQRILFKHKKKFRERQKRLQMKYIKDSEKLQNIDKIKTFGSLVGNNNEGGENATIPNSVSSAANRGKMVKDMGSSSGEGWKIPMDASKYESDIFDKNMEFGN